MVGSGERKEEKQLRAEGNNPALSSDGYSAFQEFWPEMQSDLSAGPKAVVSHWDRVALWDLSFLGKHLVGTDYSRSTKETNENNITTQNSWG